MVANHNQPPEKSRKVTVHRHAVRETAAFATVLGEFSTELIGIRCIVKIIVKSQRLIGGDP